MTPFEESIIQANFKSALAIVRHAVASVETDTQAEYFFRELNAECKKLVPKFRKGNQLSQMLVKNPLHGEGDSVLNSAAG